ncbi:MAG: PAS domain S-box protein [Proteobacteria bacterium]|nr:PAS domain S-box protein [Pseudomonadota bacterium]
MTTGDERPQDAGELRQRAEALARERAARLAGAPDALSPEELQRTLHELRVHQIELELQNEELRRAQAELEAARARYFDLYDLAPVGYCTVSATGLMLESNLATAELLGVCRSELLRQPLTRFIVKEDQDSYYLHRKNLFETGAPQSCELRLKKPDGAEVWVRMEASAAQEAEGALASRVVISDLTASKQVERELQESKHLIASVVENLPLMLFLKETSELKFVVLNRAGEELLGYDRQDLLGKNDRDLFPPEQADFFMAKDREVLANDLLVDIPEEPIQTATKGERILHTRKVCLRGADGVTKYLLGISEDITERKQAEQESAQLRASLAQSDRLASMGTLAAGVAHEINNPLSFVLYNVESAVADLPEVIEWVRRSHDALAHHLGHDAAVQALGANEALGAPAALEDILLRLREAAGGALRIKVIARGLGTFSRVDRDEVGRVALPPVIEQALSMAFNQIKYRARVVKDFSSVPPVLASDGKLAQVFLNLFINAAHAIEEGHVEDNEIRVRTWVEGDSVLAEVSDTGKGIPPEHRGRVFEPFFTTKEVRMGSGLGLSITKNIVTAFGGSIAFTSEVGKGTSFVVRLPRLPADWRSGQQSVPTVAAVAPTTRGRILVVDDERGVRAALAQLLGRDHEVVTAGSGEEGKQLLAKDRAFDVIYCDLMMPRISGMELHAWLAERDAELAAKVVFITGGAFTPGASDYLAKVGNLRIEKPFDSVAFKRTTQELVLAARTKRED